MNVICPKCRRPIPVSPKTPLLKCMKCNLTVDRLQFGLSPGLTSTPFVRDLRGETVGGYRIHELLGAGSVGVAYRARKEPDGVMAAFKVLHYDLLRKGDFLARFKQDIRTLSRLDHANVARIMDFGQQDNLFYVVSELVEGVPLSHYMQSFQLGWPEVRTIVKGIGAALAYAHRRGIHHRNLKPDNVIMGQGILKVVDFGLTHLTAGENRLGTLNTPASLMATGNYMAPEQRVRDGKVDSRADLYSLGVIFYELLTGRMPFGAIQPPSQVNPRIPKKVDRIALKALAPDPDQRYQMVEEMLADVQAVGSGRTAAAAAANRTSLRVTLVILALLSIGVYLQPRLADRLFDWATGAGASLQESKTIRRVVQAPAPAVAPEPAEAEPSGITGAGPPDGLALHEEPSWDSPVVGQIDAQSHHQVLVERRLASGELWRYVQTEAGLSGWTASSGSN